MKEYKQPQRTGQKYTDLNFPSRPTSLPVHPISGTVIARIGKTGKEKVVECESLEEVQILFDLAKSGDLTNLKWGIIQSTTP